MLVLSRKSGERILIGDDVAITVVRIGPNSVRIGIEAPKSMNIVREELCDFGAFPLPVHTGVGLGVRLPGGLSLAHLALVRRRLFDFHSVIRKTRTETSPVC